MSGKARRENRGEFQYDFFLDHSAKDKAVVRPLAERLRKEGLKMWFEEWEIPVAAPRESAGVRSARPTPQTEVSGALTRRRYAEKIEDELERSRLLACPSEESARRRKAGTFRFRDPLNQERRFIPLRLDDAPIKGSLAQFR